MEGTIGEPGYACASAASLCVGWPAAVPDPRSPSRLRCHEPTHSQPRRRPPRRRPALYLPPSFPCAPGPARPDHSTAPEDAPTDGAGAIFHRHGRYSVPRDERRRLCFSYSWLIQAFFTTQSAGLYPHQPFYLPHQPFGNCQCPTSVLPFSVTVHHGRARQHVKILWCRHDKGGSRNLRQGGGPS